MGVGCFNGFIMNGFHHVRARVRKTQGLEPFPARGAFKRVLDSIMYVVGIFAPLALLPQILKLYRTQSAEGLSLLTWVLVASINSLWALYGLAHKDKQLFLANLLMVTANVTIIIGVLLY